MATGPVEVNAVVSGRTGEGAPALVLSNSLGTDLSMWEPNLPALEEHFRVVRYDTRGHGASPVTETYAVEDLADDVVALLDRLGIAKAHFAGVSLGGMTGIALGARHPDRVDRLALLCTAAWLDFAGNYAERAVVVRTEGSTASLAPGVVENWFTPGWRAEHPEAVARFEQMVAATPAEGYAAACDALAAMDLRPLLADITAPTLVVSGADDPSIGPAYQQALADGITGARLLSVAPAAHIANVEQVDAVDRALIDHFSHDSHDTEKNS